MADYNQFLHTAADTSKTVETVSRGFNAKNLVSIWWGMIVLVLLTIVTIFIVKKFALNEAGNLWDFISSPWRNLIARIKAADEISATGQKTTIKDSQKAKQIADKIYSCFQPFGDDEQLLYNILRNEIANNADWVAVKGQFGIRTCPKPTSFVGVKHTGDLEHVISHNLSPREHAIVRQILASKDIQTNI